MAHQATERNPFMLMINPEVVIAAMEKSERLSALNRQLCRPLDRAAPAGQTQAEGDEESGDDSAETTSAR
jgi:hypothetical protein